MCYFIFFGINPHVSKHHAFCLHRVTILLQRGRVPCDHYPWCIGPHHTVYPPLYRNSLGPPPLYRDPPGQGPIGPCLWHLVAKTGDLFKLPHLRTSLLLVTSGGQDWRPTEACSLEPHPPRAEIWWLDTDTRGANKRYGTHPTGECFLLVNRIPCLQTVV